MIAGQDRRGDRVMRRTTGNLEMTVGREDPGDQLAGKSSCGPGMITGRTAQKTPDKIDCRYFILVRWGGPL